MSVVSRWSRGRGRSRKADSPCRPLNTRKTPNRMAGGNRKASTGPGSARLNITFYDENCGRPESENPWGCRVSASFSSVAFERDIVHRARINGTYKEKKKSVKEMRFQSCNSCYLRAVIIGLLRDKMSFPAAWGCGRILGDSWESLMQRNGI